MLLPTNEPNDRTEFVEDRGTPAGRVSLPRKQQSFGLEKGTVYLQRPIPVTTPSSGSPTRTA